MNEGSANPIFAPALFPADLLDELPVAYVEMDRLGTITRANRASLELHPKEHGDLVGKLAWDLMPINQREQSCAAYMLLMETGEDPQVVRRSLFTRSGEYRTYKIFRRFLRDADGAVVGMRTVSMDVTQSERELEDARRKLLWQTNILESISEAVIVADALGFVQSLNPAAEALTGWKAEDLVGTVIEQGLPLVSYSSTSHKGLSFDMALQEPSKGIAVLLDHERRELRVEISTSPIVDKHTGFIEGVVSVLRRVEVEG